MKKDRNNILISVLCGVVVCFMCLGVVFLLPTKNKNELKSKDNNLSEEINLGETSCAVTSGPVTVYDDCSAVHKVSNCSLASSSGACYEGGWSVDTSYCGSDDGIDCCGFRRYMVSCTYIAPTAKPTTAPTAAPTANPTSPSCNAPCCISGNTSYDSSACSSTTMAAGIKTCGACPTPTPKPTTAPTAAPTANPTSPSCNTPCCISGNTSYDSSACSSTTMAAGIKTCGACPTPSSNPTPAIYTVTFYYADESGRFTHQCKTNADGNGINESSCVVNHIWCGKYSPNACIGRDCQDGIGQNQVGAIDVAVLKNQKYTSDAEYHCVAGTSGGPVIITPTPASGTTPVPTPKPTATPKPVIYKCYIDENNNYHWSSTPENSWIIAKDKDGKEITNSKVCPPKEACYQDTNGEYHWGEYSTKEGYTYHAEITNKDACKKDEEIGCYKKGDDYVWTKTPPADYVKVDVTYDKCEKPACYYVESKKQRVWGYYSKVNGYYKIVDENDMDVPFEKCINEACYVCNGDKYVWGDYSADSVVCKIIPSITDASKCNNEVPVQPTGVSISAIVYTFVAILMAFGIGFIYYSTMRKNNN